MHAIFSLLPSSLIWQLLGGDASPCVACARGELHPCSVPCTRTYRTFKVALCITAKGSSKPAKSDCSASSIQFPLRSPNTITLASDAMTLVSPVTHPHCSRTISHSRLERLHSSNVCAMVSAAPEPQGHASRLQMLGPHVWAEWHRAHGNFVRYLRHLRRHCLVTYALHGACNRSLVRKGSSRMMVKHMRVACHMDCHVL